MEVTNYEYLFGSVDSAADFIMARCPYDCLACPFLEQVCNRLWYLDEPDIWRDKLKQRLTAPFIP